MGYYTQVHQVASRQWNKFRAIENRLSVKETVQLMWSSVVRVSCKSAVHVAVSFVLVIVGAIILRK